MRKRQHPDTPFPVGTEYYRGPTPRPDCWDGDFARLRAAGFRIVRSHSYWNWMEPSPGRYELDDFDRLFDLAERHGLAVWMDVMLATHGACPEWLTRDVPDLRVVTYRGQPVQPFAGAAYPQGGVIHCYDHPAWREHGGALLRHVVTRYRDRPGLLIWGLWDSINLPSAWSPMTEGYPCYCEHTLARYQQLAAGALHAGRAQRPRPAPVPQLGGRGAARGRTTAWWRCACTASSTTRTWPGSLRWMVDEVERLDPHHEVRAHGAWYPRPWDEGCAPHVDSWGMSMPSNHLLTGDDPGRLAERAFAFDWSRSVGRGGRWWHEEIYAGMSPAGVTWQKQTDPRELTTLLWLTLAGGAAGAMFWQYRPEYLSFESPGYNLVAPDGEPTARFAAAASAIRQIEGLAGHLPLECPRAEVGVVYHPASQDLFLMGGEGARFLADLRGVYRTLWTHGIPADVLTPRMDWAGYRVLFLPNVALMDEETRDRIERTLRESPETRLVAEGSFGLYSAEGQTSYRPPEGFADRFGVRLADVSRVTERDLATGGATLTTPFGAAPLVTPCGYAVLEPQGETRAIATLRFAGLAPGAGTRRWPCRRPTGASPGSG